MCGAGSAGPCACACRQGAERDTSASVIHAPADVSEIRARIRHGSHVIPLPARPAGHAPQLNFFPVGSCAAATSKHRTPRAQGVELLRCGGLLLAAQPSTSTHCVSPLPSYPAAHAPQEGPEGVSVQSECGAQLPLLAAQEAASGRQPAGPSALPRRPAGQVPQEKLPGVCEGKRRGNRGASARIGRANHIDTRERVLG